MRYNDLEDGYVQTSIGRIHYKHHGGNGKKVIFLHGLGASTRSFARFIEQLPDNLEVYLLDLLGHGDSEAPQIEYKTSTQVKIVREFLEIKQLEDSYIFGHSYGAWIAAATAQDDYKGNGIIIEDAPGLADYFEDVKRSGGEEERKENLFKESLKMNPREHVLKSIVYSRTPDDYLTKDSLSGIVRPTLIIWGSDDKTVDVKYAKLLNDYIKGSTLEIVEGAGHVPHYTHAKAVANLMLKFIS